MNAPEAGAGLGLMEPATMAIVAVPNGRFAPTVIVCGLMLDAIVAVVVAAENVVSETVKFSVRVVPEPLTVGPVPRTTTCCAPHAPAADVY